MLAFSRLPIELRIKIWEYALPGGRNIEIYPTLINRKEITWKAVQCSCPTRCNRLPSVAQVNSEARAVFFRHFTTCFDTYIQWRNDTIFVQRTSVMRSNLNFNAGSKEIQALDKIISGSPRSSELRSFAITTNLSWIRNGLPQIISPHTSNDHECELQRNLNPKSTFRELLLVGSSGPYYAGRRAGFNGLGFEFVDYDDNKEAVYVMQQQQQQSNTLADYQQQLLQLDTQNRVNAITLWRAKWQEEGKATPPPYRIARQKDAPNCFKDTL
ncbi:hypothetical protein EYC80_004496 [Monilinia laxa]|uniref:2EXR domain-containing protein n=1 Tax=Monilinia laxa TaxID=61186 RepID=A0A5N6KH64_MONLA|nr:hypothetical protein EYC80_004496 [Monilinia laxa]